MKIIKITENKKEKLSDYAEKALKNMGKLMQCIEELDEDHLDIPVRRSRHSGAVSTASPEQRTARFTVNSASLLA